MQRFRRYRKKTRGGGARNSPPPVGRGLTGIQLPGTIEARISQYADDTVLFLKDSSHCVQGAMEELKIFSAASGLKLNVEKTSCLRISDPNSQTSENLNGVKWVNQIKILGITFTNNNTM